LTHLTHRNAVLCSPADLPGGGLRALLDDLRQTETPENA